MTEQAPDEFDQSIKRQILDAYGYASEAELDAAIEEQLPGYLAAHAEREAEKVAFTAELQGRVEEAAAAVTAWGRAHGMLPDGVELVPIDLQVDAQWVASAPWLQKGGVTWNEVRMETRPAPFVDAGLFRPAGEFQRQSDAFVEGQLLAVALEEFGLLDGLIATVGGACESVLALARTLRLEPWPHGWNEPCFCHPKPFPAARDYRRRTKHRNRRRKT